MCTNYVPTSESLMKRRMETNDHAFALVCVSLETTYMDSSEANTRSFNYICVLGLVCTVRCRTKSTTGRIGRCERCETPSNLVLHVKANFENFEKVEFDAFGDSVWHTKLTSRSKQSLTICNPRHGEL